MAGKRILIVDDEAPILSVLRRSLEKLDLGYEVSTASGGDEALEQLRQLPFDLVITDYRMDGLDGLQLIEAVRSLRPSTRTILMTAYGSDRVEEQARRLKAYRYLLKPLQIDDFREAVKSAVSDMAISRPGILILSDAHHEEIAWALKRLQMEVGARFVVLADADGHPVVRIGSSDSWTADRIARLVRGCVAGLCEVGRALDEPSDACSLHYRETPSENLYVIDVGGQLFLLFVLDQGPYTSKLSTVWNSARQLASMLLLNLVHKKYADPGGLYGTGLDKVVGDELDRLLVSAEPDGAKDGSTNHPG